MIIGALSSIAALVVSECVKYSADSLIDKMYELGAYDMFYTGMLD